MDSKEQEVIALLNAAFLSKAQIAARLDVSIDYGE
jgi:hypothetical protein